jgi:hypothetical protein
VGINFPNAPTINQLYPQPPVAGMPVYRWDGQKWMTAGANSVYVYVGDTPPGAPDNSLWWESDSGVLYVRYNDGDSTQWVAITPASQPPAPIINNDVGRNLMHNPLFNIAQRGAGPFNASGYTLDRWSLGFSSDTGVGVSQIALVDAARTAIADEAAVNCLQLSTTGSAAAGAFTEIIHGIENVRRTSGKTVTISFWANASVAGLKLGLNGNSNYGSGGTPSGSVAWLATGIAITLGTTWARYSATFTLPSSIGKTFGTNANSDANYLQIFLSSGATNNQSTGNIGVQSGTVQLWGLQLEIGSVATPLEKPDPAQDLAKCQRFYQAGNTVWFYAYGTAGSVIGYAIPFPVAMRGTPTIVLSGQAYVNASNLTVSSYPAGATFYASITAVGNAQFNSNYTASADL